MDNLEDYWDKPRTITARQLAQAIHETLIACVYEPTGVDPHFDQAAAIIAAIPETAEPDITKTPAVGPTTTPRSFWAGPRCQCACYGCQSASHDD